MLGMLLQRFDLVDHLDYQLHIKTTLTVKPADFHIQVRPRPDVHIERAGRRTSHARRSHVADGRGRRRHRPARAPPRHQAVGAVRVQPRHRRVHRHPARPGGHRARLRRDRRRRSTTTSTTCPTGGALSIVSASYNGTPPDNAAAFCRWLSSARRRTPRRACRTPCSAAATPSGPSTYQAVPTLIDEQLEAHGGQRVHPRGEGNAAGDFDADYRAWHGELWADVAAALDLPAGGRRPRRRPGPRLSITLTNRQVTNPVIVSYEAHPTPGPGEPRADHAATTAARRSGPTRHLEIALPAGTAYRAGDHLGVLPRNSVDLDPPGDGPLRARRRAVPHDHPEQRHATPTCRSTSPPHCSACSAAAWSCRTSPPGTTSRSSPGTPTTPAQRAALEAHGRRRRGVAGRATASRSTRRNRSVLDLLDEFPACRLPFEVYLDLLPPLRPRYYSISSSPLVEPGGLQHHRRGAARARRGPAPAPTPGSCSSYLAQLPVERHGVRVRPATRPSRSGRRRTRTCR